MDCTGHKLVERMPSATSDSKHRVANLQRGGIDWISFPFPSLMDKCYQPSAQHPPGAWNSAAAAASFKSAYDKFPEAHETGQTIAI